jgi:hypothetical protein
LRQALQARELLGGVLRGPSWFAWRTMLLAAVGEELTTSEREVFKALTGGREHEPGQMVEEFVGIVGRRGGKSRAISVLAAYIAGLCNHPALVAGERGIVLIVAPDQRQATIALDYVTAAFEQSPVLRQLIEGRTQWSLRLSNKIDVEVRAANHRHLRGPTYAAVILDEGAFLYTAEDAANVDVDILNAVRPGLATTRGPTIIISSPYSRRGVLWDSYRKHYGPNGDPAILVVKGSSKQFNSSLAQSVVDRAYERDAASASAEYGGEFRSDLEAYVSLESVNGCRTGLLERPPALHHGITYSGFADMSGGSIDSAALAIGYMDHSRQTAIVACLRERPAPHSPEEVTQDFCRTLRSYGLTTVQGDRYAGEWPREQFQKFGVAYQASALPKSQLYQDLLPLLNSRRIELVDNQKLVNQLCNLERRTARGGRDSIDHPPGQKDDCANAVAGLASILTQQPPSYLDFCRKMNGTTAVDSDPQDEWRRLRRTLFYESHGTFDLNNHRR